MELNRTLSGLVTRQTVIAYWLIPSEPAHSFFQRIINDLARRYDAPVFEPHVTIMSERIALMQLRTRWGTRRANAIPSGLTAWD